MKKIIGGKRYNTETAETIAEKDHRNYNNNYSGTTRLMVTPRGTLFFWLDTNGQDLYLTDDIWSYDTDQYDTVSGMTIINEELALKYEIFEEA